MDATQVIPPQQILVVDDSVDTRALWTLWLTAYGFSVTEAANGVEALRQIDADRPDLVLLDIKMPVMDGLETLKRLRAQDTTSQVPVIMVSALGAAVADKVRELGPDVYLAQPVQPADLIRRIRELLPG